MAAKGDIVAGIITAVMDKVAIIANLTQDTTFSPPKITRIGLAYST